MTDRDWGAVGVYLGSFVAMVVLLLWGLDVMPGKATAATLFAYLALFIWFVTRD